MLDVLLVDHTSTDIWRSSSVSDWSHVLSRVAAGANQFMCCCLSWIMLAPEKHDICLVILTWSSLFGHHTYMCLLHLHSTCILSLNPKSRCSWFIVSLSNGASCALDFVHKSWFIVSSSNGLRLLIWMCARLKSVALMSVSLALKSAELYNTDRER